MNTNILIIKITSYLAFGFLLLTSCKAPMERTKELMYTNNYSDTLQFKISEANNIIFKAILNEIDTLDLYFDSGGTEIVLKHSTIKEKTSLLDGKNLNYKSENYVPLEALNSLALNNLKFDSLSIYPVELMPKETDGHFGWNLFEGKIVELDFEKENMIVHTKLPANLNKYSKLEIEYINTLFCIKGSIQHGGENYSNRYLYDLGFQRAVVLDKDLREKAKFPNDLPVLNETVLKNSAGKEFVNKVVKVDEVCFENACATEVPVLLLSTPNPARFETHILGGEILKRFNTILDFKNGFVYLKSNNLASLPYKDLS